MIPAAVRKTDWKKYTSNQRNTRCKLHLCREALVIALILLPLENNSQTLQREALSNPATSLPQPASMAHASISWTSSASLKKQTSSCSFPSFLPSKNIRMYRQQNTWVVLQVIQVNANSGHLKAFRGEGGDEAGKHKHKTLQPPVVLHTEATASTSEKIAHTNEEEHTGIHVLAAFHGLKTLKAMRHNKLNLMKKTHFA